MVRGINLCFRRKSEFDLVFTSQIPLVRRKPVCLVDWLDAKFHHEQCAKRLLYFEKGVYIFELGAHLSEERQIVKIMQIRWLDHVNHVNMVTR